ncbi:MAG: serine/threonine-protein kinase, partial [Aureliella sp.]
MPESHSSNLDDQVPNADRLNSVMADYIRLSEKGDSPDRSALLRQFPELAEEVRQFFARRDQLNQLVVPSPKERDDMLRLLDPTQNLGADSSVPALEHGPDKKVIRDRRTDSSDSSHHGRFLPGTIMADRYRIVSMLGQGGMGEVYRADDLRLGQTVALKFLPSELAKDSRRLEYFHREVKLARQISHPNICRVYDIGEVNGQHFLSMEYIDGEDLKILLRRIGRLPKDKGIQIARQLCSGLSAAHAKGVLHRDLKPANIMIDGQGQVRITDFGLATISADGENVIGMSGTPAYMAPEQMLSGQTSVRSDIYSLGLILFEVFTGQSAHEATSLNDLRRLHQDSSSVRSPSDIVDDLDPIVERAISRCLNSDPAMRPRTVSELAVALPGGDPLAAALAAGETPHPEIVAMSGDSRPLSIKKAVAYLAIFVGGLILTLIAHQHVMHINLLEPVLSPEVLTYRAQDVLKQIGYPSLAASGDYAFRFDDFETQVENNRIAKRAGFENWPRLGFWYRESPVDFQSDTLGLGATRNGPAAVDFWYPAWTESKMQGVKL